MPKPKTNRNTFWKFESHTLALKSLRNNLGEVDLMKSGFMAGAILFNFIRPFLFKRLSAGNRQWKNSYYDGKTEVHYAPTLDGIMLIQPGCNAHALLTVH